MKHNNLRAGFTLVELMVFFLFISILIAASTPLITKRIKSVPSRTYHGKFLCYRDNMGQLHGDYYNAAGKKVKEAPVVSADSIIFEPPKRAAVFKVEMVGAGAGGYNYTDSIDDRTPRYSYFNQNGDGGYSGETVYKLSDNDIKNSLQGLTNTISAYTGKGGDSGKIYYAHSIPSQTITRRSTKWVWKNNKMHYLYYDVPNFDPSTMSQEWTIEGDGKINTKDVIAPKETSFKSWATTQFPKEADSNATKQSDGSYRRYLEYTATPYVQAVMLLKAFSSGLASLYNIPVSEDKDVDGGKGGKGTFISYTYKIDFNSAEAKGKTPQEYIKWLMDTYKSGMSTRPANEMYYWDFYPGRTVSDGSNGRNVRAAISQVANSFSENDNTSEDTAAIAGDGGDANGYAALQIGYHKYLTNKQKATGATGTQMIVQSKGRIYLSYRNGLDADSKGMIDSDGKTYPASGSGSSNGPQLSAADTSSRKYIEMISTVPVRTYYIGASGESGTYISKQVANLGESCTIYLPPLSQSLAFKEDATLITNPEPTRLVCKGWTNEMKAESGRQRKNCQLDKGTGSADCDSSANFWTYNPYANLSDSDRFTGTGFVEPPPFKIAAQLGKISQFGLFGSVFTKTPSLAEYGKGGNGAGYIDLCMKMGGQINIKTMDSSNSTPVRSRDPINFPSDPNCSMENNPRTPATAGGKGAIIISW